MKNGVQKYSREKITQAKNPNTPKPHYHSIEIILQKENTKDRNTNSFFTGI